MALTARGRGLYDEDSIVVAHCYGKGMGAQLARELALRYNAHDALVEALRGTEAMMRWVNEKSYLSNTADPVLLGVQRTLQDALAQLEDE